MMELPGTRTVAAFGSEVREKVTDSWPPKQVAKKSRAAYDEANPWMSPGSRLRPSNALKADNGPPFRFVARKLKMVRKGLGRTADFSYWQCYEDQVP
jgi:hypothetical protein